MTVARRGLLLIGGAAALGLGGAGLAGWRRMGSAKDVAEMAARQRLALHATPLARDPIRRATLPGVDLVLITERAMIIRLSNLVIPANTAQMADAAFVAEMKH